MSRPREEAILKRVASNDMSDQPPEYPKEMKNSGIQTDESKNTPEFQLLTNDTEFQRSFTLKAVMVSRQVQTDESYSKVHEAVKDVLGINPEFRNDPEFQRLFLSKN